MTASCRNPKVARALRLRPMSTGGFWKARRKAIASPICLNRRNAWKRALAALDEVSVRTHGRPFAILTEQDQDAMLGQMAEGSFEADAMRGMPSKTFWTSHVIHDVVGAYYAHPTAWSEIGFGGPASPRGYVRLGLDRRDPWEPEEAAPSLEKQPAGEGEHVR